MLYRCFALLLFGCLAWGRGDDPLALFQEAKGLLRSPGHQADVMDRLERANKLWAAQSSNAPEYAESLDLLALELRSKASSKSLDGSLTLSDEQMQTWREQAGPLTKKAFEIREAHSDTKLEDMALALELRADTLGRTTGGEDLWKRASQLRDQHIQAIFQPTPEGDKQPFKIGNEVSPPALVGKREPEYSEAARIARYSGTSQFLVTIGADGVPRDFKLVQSLGYGLDEKAAEAVSRWRFKPALKEGEPVAVTAQIEVNFRLQ